MPMLHTYRGKPLAKAPQRVRSGMLLIVYANLQKGERMKREYVTVAEWEAEGDKKFVEQMPDRRAMAARRQ